MRASRVLRAFAFLGGAAVIGAAVIFAYRVNGERPPPQPILGVVHETEIRIAPETSGRLASFRVAPGQPVRKGDVLAVLSTPELTAAVEEAKASAATAKADRTNVYAGTRKEEVDIAAQDVRIAEANQLLAKQQQVRAATLAARQFASKQQLDESTAALAKADANLALLKAAYTQSQAGPTKEERAIADAKVELAEATIADLEAKLAKTTLVAPADGVVGLLVAEPGEAISPGQPVMTLEVGSERWFTLTIREDRLAGIAIGSKLQFMTASGNRIEARVTELRPLGEFAVWRAARAVGDHDINSFLVRADPVAPVNGLEPGMTVWLDR
ncbi:MAG: efflux RND transporter periplasmic adaptor subunit [Methylobacteriaceae bacterium]|nr:efflux RND transporter periplasmic adaptor subunit [Methylobacteriaceae bacterium]